MLPIREEIVQYAEEIKKTMHLIKETNAIAHLVHRSGMWGAENVEISIDNYEVFCINDWETRFKLFVSNYDMCSSTSDYKPHNEGSVVKYRDYAKEINVCGTLYTLEEAFSNYEEIYFQHSTLNHQCALDAFDMIMYLHQDKLAGSFLLTTPMNYEVLEQFNWDYNKMMQESYERFGRYRA